MKLVEQLTDIKVPKSLGRSINRCSWSSFLRDGTSSGKVPPDIPPYVFGGWLFDATPESQLQLQELALVLLRNYTKSNKNLQILTSWNSILKATRL